jgi:quinol monooxygenase YgiN
VQHNEKSMTTRKQRPKSAKRKKIPRVTRRASAAAKLPKEAVTLVVILHPQEGKHTLLEAELRALLAPTRREEGCITYDLHRNADSAPSLLLHEVWASREHHRLHTLTPHFLRWNARKDALLASRAVTFWSRLA